MSQGCTLTGEASHLAAKFDEDGKSSGGASRGPEPVFVSLISAWSVQQAQAGLLLGVRLWQGSNVGLYGQNLLIILAVLPAPHLLVAVLQISICKVLRSALPGFSNQSHAT